MTPILSELSDVASLLVKFNSIALFVDDVRLFGAKTYSRDGYPQLSTIIEWCDKNGFTWDIRRDIFIARYLRMPLN